MKSMGRRGFIRNSLFTALSVSARASIIGVPSSFLLSGKVSAAVGTPKYTILAQSSRGESINCNGPGSFPVNNSDPARLITHPTVSELGDQVLGRIGGREFSARDFAEAVDLQLGNQTVKGSRIWTGLPQDFLDNLTCFWHQTGTNAHPEFPSVRRLMGALRDDVARTKEEELASAIALETNASLGTTLDKPFLLDGEGYFKGSPLTRYKPRQIKQLFGGQSQLGVAPDQFAALYTQTIDAVYSNLKTNGTRAQRNFLDQYASSRSQAASLGDSLGVLLEDIDNDGFANQLKTAVALIRLNVAPVISVRHEFSQDNHSDRDLSGETEKTLAALDALSQYWDVVSANNLEDQINFATLDVFGRTPHRSENNGGRDHFGKLTMGLVHGSDFKGGMIGGLTEERDRPVATGINSQTGESGNADITPGSTLAAYGKTIMRAAGIDDERLNIRVPSGKVITGAFV